MPQFRPDNLTFKKLDQQAEKLVSQGVITQKQLKEALTAKRGRGKLLGEILLENGLVSAEKLAEFMAKELQIPFVRLQDYAVDERVMAKVGEDLIRKCEFLPLFQIGDILTIATSDPLDITALDSIRKSTGSQVDVVFCLSDDLRQMIDRWFGSEDLVRKAIQNLPEPIAEGKVEPVDIAKMERSSSEAPVVKLVNSILSQAVQGSTSDIHIEPQENEFQIRFRVDGLLRKVLSPPKSLQLGVISRIKILANMDIAECRRPQDGRMRILIVDKTVDFRVSTYPTVQGEKVVIRILDTILAQVKLEDLGLSSKKLKGLKHIITKPHGLFLVTGPTGSGKTTTLYAALNLINSESRNVMTIEDPVEYRLNNITQGQVNEKVGITFSKALRSMLRQDPDVIMVGEMRDTETIQLALRAALTGHLVLSTLHTNDAASAVTRLLDMGVEPFLLSSSLLGILAQRLVRVLCQKCRQRYNPPQELLSRFSQLANPGELVFYKQVGCPECKMQGYKGRTGLFELLIPNDKITNLIMRKSSANEIRQAAIESGMKPMVENGFLKVGEGKTTLEEVLRVIA